MPDEPRPDETTTDETTPDETTHEVTTPEVTIPAATGPAGTPDAAAPVHGAVGPDAGAATQEAATSGAPASAAPSEEELLRVAVPATVRRAPRYGAFLVAGALVGMVVGLVVALATAGTSGVTGDDGGVLPFLGGQDGVRWILLATGGVLGVLVGGALALVADRRSTRRRRSAPGR